MFFVGILKLLHQPKISTCAYKLTCGDSRPQGACAETKIYPVTFAENTKSSARKGFNVLNKSPSSRKFYFEFVQNQLLDILNCTITLLSCNWSCGHDISAILCRLAENDQLLFRFRAASKSAMMLVPLLGISWIIGLFIQYSIVLRYAFIILNALQVSQGLVITYRIMTEALAHLWVGLAKRRSPSAIRIQRMALTSWALSVINLHSTSDVKCYIFPVLNYFAQMAWCCLKVAIAPFVRNNGATEQWPNTHWCMQHLLQCHQLFSCVYFFLDRVSSCSSSTVWWAQRQV